MKKALLIILLVGLSASLALAVSAKPTQFKKSSMLATQSALFTKAKQPVLASKATVAQSPFMRSSMLITSSVSKGNTSLQTLKAKDGAVTRRFTFNSENRFHRDLATSPMMAQASAVDTSFYESWEAYDDSTLNWTPSNWTELNKTGNAYVVGTTNPTWFIRTVGNAATDGTDIAWVNFDDTGLSRDEWMVSPAFTPATNDYLSFDLYYSPFWMYFNAAQYNLDGTISFDFSKPNTTMQVLVSTDDGLNWTKIWDAHNYVSRYNETNISDYQTEMWNTFNMKMEKYVGKSVKIAFRYVGKFGDSMGLDNIGVRQLKPKAKYGRPQGYFNLGFTQDFYNSSADLMLGAPAQNDIWKNNSNQDSQSFLWIFEDQKDPKATFTSTDIAPVVKYPAGSFNVPTMKATSGAYESTYKWGKSAGGAYFLSGGSSAFSWGTLGAGNYDLGAGIAAYSFKDNDYVYGTGLGKTVQSIANYFEKPVKPYILDSVWIGLGAFSAPAGSVFTMNIRKINLATGDYATIIAKATCAAADVKELQPGYFSMPFKGFITYDSLLDLEVTNDYLLINEPILVEMTGFNKTGITLAAFSQVFEKYSESNAYVIYNHYASGKRYLLSAPDYIGLSTSLLFNLAATYDYMIPDDSTFLVPNGGGSKTFKVSALHQPSDWSLAEPLPSWLTSSNTYDAQTGDITYTLTAEALPSGVEGRGLTLSLTSVGAEMNIEVLQGNYAALPTVKMANTKVVATSNRFEMSYSSDFRNVMIFNVAGQVVGSYILPSDGKFAVPTSNLSKGVYFLHFSGKGTQTIRVIKD